MMIKTSSLVVEGTTCTCDESSSLSFLLLLLYYKEKKEKFPAGTMNFDAFMTVAFFFKPVILVDDDFLDFVFFKFKRMIMKSIKTADGMHQLLVSPLLMLS